ncbi:MAG: YcaO-like family protein, partial [Candidatus Eremiobacteraeota bacterium]|nr:YcaO-like family protein [Candidatus Eremiobacteraeota bacterium]
ICDSTSSGLAAGTNFEDAALRAVYESIERDAFMLTWLAGLPATRLYDDGTVDSTTRQAIANVEHLGAHVELYLLDMGLSHPTVVCAGLGDGEALPGITIGLGTHADFDVALRRAALEHAHCGMYIRRLMLQGEHKQVCAPRDVVSLRDHGLYYAHVKHVAAFDRFRSCASATALASARAMYKTEATLVDCAAALGAGGVRIAAVDVTSPDVALASVSVVRTFGVNMQPMFFGHPNKRTNNPRLSALLHGNEVVQHPHPLP